MSNPLPQPNVMLRAPYGWFLIVPAGIQAASLQRFAAFAPGGSGFAPGAVEFSASLQMAGNDRSAIRAIRDFYNRWRFGDAASFSDHALLSLLARDARGPSLSVFYLPREELTGFTLVGGDAAQPVPAPSGPVGSWSVKQKIVAMFKAVPDSLSGAAQAEFLAFISPVNLAIMAGILVAIAGVQAIPGADAIVDGLIAALAWAQFGWAGLLAARDFVQAVAQAGQAKSNDDIKLAAKLAAAALVSLGLVVFLKKLTGKVKQSDGLKGEETPKSTPKANPKQMPKQRRVASEAELEAQRRTVAESFYAKTGWSNERIADHLRGIDFSKDISIVKLPQGSIVSQWVNPARGVGNYFAPIGTDAGQLGISSIGKQVQQFNVTEDTSVLQSTAAPILDTWSGDNPVQTPGGGTQWFTLDKSNFEQVGEK